MKRYIKVYVIFIAIAICLPLISYIFSVFDKLKQEPEYPISAMSGEHAPEDDTEYPLSSVAYTAFDVELPETVTVLLDGQAALYPLERYVLCVLLREMPASFDIEALKAQAVAIRTFAFNRILNPDNAHPNAGVCDSTSHCTDMLAYDKIESEMGQAWVDKYLPLLEQAVTETAGELMVYEGEPILALFHASSGGGYTESSEEAWGTEVPYLQSVPSYDLDGTYINEKQYKLSDFAAALGVSENAISNIKISRTSGGSVDYISVADKQISGTTLRKIFGLNSTCLSIEIGEKVTIKSEGNGHGIGLSQVGANNMAAAGNSYDEILLHYYSGAMLTKSDRQSLVAN